MANGHRYLMCRMIDASLRLRLSMGISIADLPLAYQEQAVRKYKASLQKEYGSGDRKNKYNNQHATRSGIKFDSKKEANRYDELMLMFRSGDIYDLRL